MEKVEKSRIFALKELGYEQNCLAIEGMHKKEMAARTEELRKVDKAMARQIAGQVGGKVVDLVIDDATDWAIVMEPLRDLKIYFVLQRYSPEFEDEVLTFYGAETTGIGIPVEELFDFTHLCANALVRAAISCLSPKC
jgi:hypothetical protein